MNATSAASPDPAVPELAATVQMLTQRLASIEEWRYSVEKRPPREQIRNATRAVQNGTEALFAAHVSLEQAQDPEIDEEYLVVRVRVTGSPDAIADQYRQWHRQLGDWAPGIESHFRLAVEIDNGK